jgi:predicted nucleic acid-binding protein
LTFDLGEALKSLKPQKRIRPLARRQDEALVWIDDLRPVGGPILLDTTVYIDVLQGRSSEALDEFVKMRSCLHSAVCLSELTHAFGRLDPADARTKPTLKAITRTIDDIPVHRLIAPDVELWGGAGILAGVLFRLGGFPVGSERKCLNDALLYLQARKLGCSVLTRNAKDFDFLNQLVPDGRVFLYRNVQRQSPHR